MNLGSGQGITSIFLAKEYGFKVYATDLWSDAEENRKFFEEMGLTEEQLDYIQTIEYWKNIISKSKESEIIYSISIY